MMTLVGTEEWRERGSGVGELMRRRSTPRIDELGDQVLSLALKASRRVKERR